MQQAQLMAHCGSSKITREELKVIPTPAGSTTHQPLPHFEIVGALVETLSFRQISVVRDEYAVSSDGMKMFGVLDLETTFDGCRFSIGVRNSNDKSMRLDHLLLSPQAAAHLINAGVDRFVRGQEGASDHAPAWIELNDGGTVD